MRSKVLVVEDDGDLRRGLCMRLRSLGYEVVTAQDGLGAVSTARQEHPDVVLLDIGLPAGDGFTVLERYGNLGRLAEMPVVILTGRDPASAEQAARRFNVAGLLRKPVENDELAGALRRALTAASGRDREEPPPLTAPRTHGSTPSSWFG